MATRLPKGRTWVAHDGKQAIARRRKRLARIERRRLAKGSGIPVDGDGKTPAGVVVPSAAEVTVVLSGRRPKNRNFEL